VRVGEALAQVHRDGGHGEVAALVLDLVRVRARARVRVRVRVRVRDRVGVRVRVRVNSTSAFWSATLLTLIRPSEADF